MVIDKVCERYPCSGCSEVWFETANRLCQLCAMTLDFLREERWIPAWSMMWLEISDLQRRGLVRIRWEDGRAMVQVAE